MSDTPPHLPIDEMLCFSIYGAHQAFNRMYRKLLDEAGLTYPQYIVMRLLWEKAPRSVSQIGEVIGLESNTLTPLLKRLEKLGMVTRTRDPKDERRVLITLTENGQALETDLKDVLECAWRATGLSLEEVRSMVANMNKLKDRLNRIPEKSDLKPT